MTAYIGQPIPRFEDKRFVAGEGRYTDDLDAPDAAHAVIVRSPHAHAHVDAVETEAAEAAPGVLGRPPSSPGRFSRRSTQPSWSRSPTGRSTP